MTAFTYKARNASGQVIKAVIEADSEREARTQIKSKGLSVLEINGPKSALQAELKLPTSTKVPPKEMAIFSRQMSTLLDSGVPIVQSLKILEDQTNHAALKKVLGEVSADVQGGLALSEAMSKHRAFNQLFLSLIRAGESSGKLSMVIGELADFTEKEVALAGKMKSAMTYPVSVLVIALGITYFLLTKIVPQFAGILTEIGGQLPPLTLFVMSISTFLQTKGWIIGLIIAAAVAGVGQLGRSPEGAMKIDQVKMRLPVMGPLLKKGSIARFTRTMSLLIDAGVILNQSLQISKNVTGLLPVSQAVSNAERAVLSGMPMTSAMAAEPTIFPKMMVSMTAIGEETGSLGTMMKRVAEFYDREVDQAVDQMTAMIEPLMIIFLGTVVGTIVGAMFMPLFSIIGQLSG